MQPLSVEVEPNSNALYNRFIVDGRIGHVTFWAFFAPLVCGDAWLVLTRANLVPDGLVGNLILFPLVILAFLASFSGVIGLYLGRNTVTPVLRGTLRWQQTALLTALAYTVNMLYYVFNHVGAFARPGLTLTAISLISLTNIIVLTPLSEELVFQCYLQTRLQRFGFAPAILITTLLFVTLHIAQFTQMPNAIDIMQLFKSLYPPLLIYALLRQVTGSLAAVIALHSIENLTLFLTGAT